MHQHLKNSGVLTVFSLSSVTHNCSLGAQRSEFGHGHINQEQTTVDERNRGS